MLFFAAWFIAITITFVLSIFAAVFLVALFTLQENSFVGLIGIFLILGFWVSQLTIVTNLDGFPRWNAPTEVSTNL